MYKLPATGPSFLLHFLIVIAALLLVAGRKLVLLFEGQPDSPLIPTVPAHYSEPC